MKQETMQVKLGGKTVAVPVFRDETRTLRIVDQVNQRLKEIEETSPRIDTQAFALQTAYTFAVELARTKAQSDADEQETLLALTRLSRSLSDALKVLERKPV